MTWGRHRWFYLVSSSVKGFQMNKTLRNALLAAGVIAASAVQQAQAAVDVADVVAEIAGAATPIGLIGGASLLVAVGIKVYKWVRRAL